MKQLESTIKLDGRLDGARILVRHFLTTTAPHERWVRELSPCGKHVRLARTRDTTDAGAWFRVFDLRVESILEEAKAPKLSESKDEPGFKWEENQ